jgi:uncharacterized membrane protein
MGNSVRFISAGPLSVFALILLVVFILLLIPLFILGLIGAAFTRLGFSWIAALAAIFLMLLGSFVNIPLWRFRRDIVRMAPEYPSPSGFNWIPPSAQVWETRLSLNLGGAAIPLCLAAYLLVQGMGIAGSMLLVQAGVVLLLVAAVTFVSTRCQPGIGIQVPLLIPGLIAILASLLVCGGTGPAAAVAAFAGGTVGTLLGGNFFRLFRIRDLGTAELSIGGAGTFGSVFLCCILPALIA